MFSVRLSFVACGVNDECMCGTGGRLKVQWISRGNLVVVNRDLGQNHIISFPAISSELGKLARSLFL